MFTDRSPGRGPDPEADDLLIRAAMEQAADGAPALPDLVPVALVQGRRRRNRARATVGAGVTGVLALGVFGAVVSMWSPEGGTQPTGTWSAASQSTTVSPPPSPAATETPQPVRTPVHIEPTPGETGMADLPPAERARQEQFQQQAAALLDELLPGRLGTVRPVDLAVNRYQAGRDGNTFPVIFSVRPKAAPGEATPADPPCRDIPSKGLRCRSAMLPGGIAFRSVTAVGDTKESYSITSVDLRFGYGDSTVRLSVGGDDSTMVSAPVNAEQLVTAVSDSRFLELVKYADSHPMEDKEHTVRGG
ncbi:hypothetical protein [Streptomyces sp. NBC_00385]|uniref:hypothetical protein n=1 Tax=Streptomyces sp. NBC_00385 TaxID=2975733 RepID=UPI002DDB148F|nr:hypothetical protein [Streptomyces sp. NBC_00385]WRZ04605.1 hypothetical protein OG959_15180 [Streptomyces sp. NBC_00385]